MNKIVKVRFLNSYASSSKTYHYEGIEGLREGDIVVVDTAVGEGVAQVIGFLDRSEFGQLRNVMLNITELHPKFTKLASDFRKAKAKVQLDKLIAEYKHKMKYEEFASKDERIAELYNEVFGESVVNE